MKRRLSIYWHTLRYLKPVQFYGRAWFRLIRPKLDLASAPPLRHLNGNWVSPARRHQSLVKPMRFQFLNLEHGLIGPNCWDDVKIEKLWRYNLHYFDDLNAEGAKARPDWHRELLLRWVHENPPAIGTAWEPYPTSLRIVNWVKWSLAGNSLPPECLHSLAVQARWLSRRLEIHLLGNHLFANAKALVFAGLFFSGPEADRWLEKGLRILAREVPEQILPDGGQFERSTMYHALALEDMLDLWNASRAFPDEVPQIWKEFVTGWPEVVGRMRHWLAAMCHPDGEISFFNDSAIGISPSPAELEAYAERLGLPLLADLPDVFIHLAESGYLRIKHGPMVALLDVAPVGPDYLPGHAHADTLSIELSLFGQRVLVNSGTSCYGVGEERSRQRGTAAHNTVVVDGQDSSEVWGGFRVARRAKPFLSDVLQKSGSIVITASHDGYRRLPGGNEHRRQLVWEANSLLIEDEISGPFAHAEAYFHLHPDVRLHDLRISDDRVVLMLPNGQEAEVSVKGGRLRTDSTTWHPQFGISIPNVCLVASLNIPKMKTKISWGEKA